tara:strand:+ start:52 stop:369 length:318 start_codon:yes stop_codon:yes gene_type:complete
MSKLIPTYIEQALRIEVLERELAEARAEVVRLKWDAESWEQVFDKTCQLLAEAKEELAEAVAKERERCARECAEVCHKMAEDSDSYVVHDGDTCAEQIKQHFGVK